MLIETKLYPPRRRPDLLRRSRLLEFLHEHIANKLLLLCAPPAVVRNLEEDVGHAHGQARVGIAAYARWQSGRHRAAQRAR